MEKSVFYTKGEREEITSRMNQVHTITLFCPISDLAVMSLQNSFEMILPKYKKSDVLWVGVPSIDALNVFLFTTSYIKTQNLDINLGMIEAMASSLKMFKKLKKINFCFTDDKEIENSYNVLLKRSNDKMKKCIYNVELLELNLSDMFSQTIIDLVNKIFMCNEIIPNSYLERKFHIDFNYDDYMTFMDMFIGNNKDNLDMLDNKICDYFRLFPPLVNEQKPSIRLITNYEEGRSV